MKSHCVCKLRRNEFFLPQKENWLHQGALEKVRAASAGHDTSRFVAGRHRSIVELVLDAIDELAVVLRIADASGDKLGDAYVSVTSVSSMTRLLTPVSHPSISIDVSLMSNSTTYIFKYGAQEF